MHIVEKQDGTIKGRMTHNGKATRDWLTKEDMSSPTVGFDSLMHTSVINAKEKCSAMKADAPNAFIKKRTGSKQRSRKDSNEDHRSADGSTSGGVST